MGSFLNLKIASFNCRGLNDEVKRRAVFEIFEKSDYTIILLQETKLEPSQHHEVKSEWKKGPILLNSMMGKKRGTGILFNTQQVKLLNDIYDSDSRIISADINFYGSKLHIVNTYFPNDTPEQYRFIQSTYKYLMSDFPIIWGGDCNMTTNNRIDRWPPRSSNDAHVFHLNRVLDTFNLVDTCRVLFPNDIFFTYRKIANGSCTMSRIDKLFASKNFETCKYSQVDCEFSDHDIIECQLQYQSKLILGRGTWRNNVRLYSKENFLEKFQNCWDEFKDKKRGMYYNNFTKWWNEVKYVIKLMMIEYGKTVSLYEKREINMMRNTLDHLLQLVKNEPENKQYVKQYFDYKNKLSKSQLKKSKEKFFKENVGKFLNGDCPTQEFFQTFKRKTDPNSKIIHKLKDEEGVEKADTYEILKIGENFYKELYSKKIMNSNRDLEESFLENINRFPQEYAGMIVAVITSDEVWMAIKSFKDGKMPGPDGLSIEFYKKVWPIIKDELTKLYNT